MQFGRFFLAHLTKFGDALPAVRCFDPRGVLAGECAGHASLQTYRAKYHTSTSELAEIANRAKPGILVVYHTSGRGPNGRIPYEQLLREIQKTYREW